MCLLDLDWFTCWALNKMGISCVVCHGIFKWTGFFSHSYPHPMSFCTKVSYRDAESTVSMLTPHLQIILHKGPLLSCNIDCSIFTTYLYVILLAGLARSCRIHISKNLTKTFSLGRRCPSGRMRGGGYRLSPLPSPIVCVGPSSPGGRGFFDGRMDSATSPSAPRRMTVWGG